MRRTWLFIILSLPLLSRPARVQEYVIPRAGSFPQDPTVDRSGIVWYTAQRIGAPGRLDPVSGVIT